MPITWPLNEWQKVACRAYGDGDFSIYAEDANQIDPKDAEHLMSNRLGDTTFYSVIVELDESEDCNSAEEAADRMRMIREDLNAVEVALRLMA
jgi:hypothetical protein